MKGGFENKKLKRREDCIMTTYEEPLSDGEIWDEVFFDFFPNADSEEEIADELDDLWND